MPADIIVVIDTFRAATTACHLLIQAPAEYLVVASSDVAARLAATRRSVILIGKPEIGADLIYDVPNSPTRVSSLDVSGHTVIHRTTAGAAGLVRARAPLVLLAGFVNVQATVNRIRDRDAELVPMGHEGTVPSLEDDLTATCIRARLDGVPFDLEPHLPALRTGPGRYFFTPDQPQYPEADFALCLAVDAFDFAIQAEGLGDYVRLSRA